MLLLLRAAAADAQVTLTQATNFGIDVAQDGRLAMDLLGGIWLLPAGGGQAASVTPVESGAREPAAALAQGLDVGVAVEHEHDDPRFHGHRR